MTEFQQHTGWAMPFLSKDVDTDQIIPAQFLTSMSQEGYGENLFRRLRNEDPNFPMNQEKYKGAEVLVVNSNFGCGSSREHAVWALMGAGFRVIIGKSFADIFSSNAAKNGLLLVALPAGVIETLLANSRTGKYEITTDLLEQKIILPSGQMHLFQFDPFRKHCILNGLNDIDYILSHQEKIKLFREKQRANIFYSTLRPNR